VPSTLQDVIRYGRPRPWQAYTEGKAKVWNRRFATHKEAFHWAEFVALAYRDNDDHMAKVLCGAYLRAKAKADGIWQEDKEFLE
jgi:hypothetical protein